MRTSRAVVLVALAGCYEPVPLEQSSDEVRPGSEAWEEANASCERDADCHPDELCLEQVCQLKQCNRGPYTTDPPLAPERALHFDHDLAVAGPRASRVQTWQLSVAGPATATSVASAGAPAVDLAAGNLLPGPAQELVMVEPASTKVLIKGIDGQRTLDVGVVPIAIGAVNVHRDRYDHVVALSRNALIVCNPDDGSCSERQLTSGRPAVDVAVGDVDGDGNDEVVVALASRELVVINLDEPAASDAAYVQLPINYEVSRVAVGDLDGDGVAEVIGLEDRGGRADRLDVVHFHRMVGNRLAELRGWRVPGVDDIAAGDIDGDRIWEVFLLRGGRQVDIVRLTDDPPYGQRVHTVELDGPASRVAAIDLDGDSTTAHLIDGPRVLQGRPVPLIVAFFPPYWHEHSPAVADVNIGNSTIESENFTDTVGFRAGVEVGLDVSFLDVVSTSLSAEIGRAIGSSYSRSTKQFVGNRVWSRAEPRRFGPHYGTVMTAYNCYHQYTYRFSAPAGKQGIDGKEFVVLVPVDSNIALLSTIRFNALAAALGGLPHLPTPHTIGLPSSYPTVPVTLSGAPVPADDLLVEAPPTYTASEVGYMGFSLALWDTSERTDLQETSVHLSASATVFGYKFGGSVRGSIGSSHSISLGTEVVFGGKIPALPDDPETPEDEYQLHSYSFAPIIYRDRYQTLDGAEVPFYVFHHMVGF
jgi:hypothetical protein